MTLLPQEIIKNKRDGKTLSQEELAFFVQGITNDRISEGQIAAMTMAIYFNGMEAEECRHFTEAMLHSGDVLDWSDLNGPVVDKHSTGGVGDKVSLMLAPIVAACGAFVPMISGRGLGHTGGTLDKLEAIPGYNTRLSIEQFKQVVNNHGCAIIGQTDNLAPADKRIYATRDITATVDSIPLITASILSKKLAAGLDALVMDVKCGNGAFAADLAMAQDLARSLVATSPIPTKALITDMNQVLGHTVGHVLELQETIDFLSGQPSDSRLHQLVISLAAEMLQISGLEEDLATAKNRAETVLSNGQAAEHFAQMVEAQGGPSDLLENPKHRLPQAKLTEPVFAKAPGYVAGIECRQLGLAVIGLGGGRTKATDVIDHAVGLSQVQGMGTAVDSNTPLAYVHANDATQLQQAKDQVQKCFSVTNDTPEQLPVILQTV